MVNLELSTIYLTPCGVTGRAGVLSRLLIRTGAVFRYLQTQMIHGMRITSARPSMQLLAPYVLTTRSDGSQDAVRT